MFAFAHTIRKAVEAEREVLASWHDSMALQVDKTIAEDSEDRNSDWFWRRNYERVWHKQCAKAIRSRNNL